MVINAWCFCSWGDLHCAGEALQPAAPAEDGEGAQDAERLPPGRPAAAPHRAPKQGESQGKTHSRSDVFEERCPLLLLLSSAPAVHVNSNPGNSVLVRVLGIEGSMEGSMPDGCTQHRVLVAIVRKPGESCSLVFWEVLRKALTRERL